MCVVARQDMLLLGSRQTDSQVVTSSQKLNLRRELHYVVKRNREFPRKFTQRRKKTETHFKTTCLVPRGQNADISSISLLSKLIQQQMDITQLVLFCGWWPNGEKLELTCVQI